MADKSKFFCVAVEGATASDGRTIERSWIQDMAAGYAPATYGARINLEHIRGATGQAPFKAMGDVLAVEAREVTLSIAGKDEKRLALFARIDPTDDLVALTKDRQKIYTSIEVAPNFAGTGKAGLVGLAVTDTPASLGTEALAFSVGEAPYAKVLKATLDGRKTNSGNVFSAAHETTIEFEAAAAAASAADDKVSLGGLAAAFAAALGFKPAAVAAPAAATPPSDSAAPAFTAEAFTQALTRFGEGMAASQAQALAAAITPLKTDLAALQAKVDATPAADPARPAASGGQGQFTAADF